MSAVQHSPAKEQLYKFDEYSSQASTRSGAYSRMSMESGSSAGALRVAASRAGLTSPSHSLKFAFSMEEEIALVVVCQLYARQGTPLSVIDFIKLASHFAKKEEGKLFSRHFVDDFIDRHDDVLCKAKGKLTSPTRCYETMKEKTYEFIDSMNEIMRTNTINSKNMVVFDETVLGDSLSLPLCIG